MVDDDVRHTASEAEAGEGDDDDSGYCYCCWRRRDSFD